MSEREAPADRLPVGLAGVAGLDGAQVSEARRIHGFNDVVPESTAGWLTVARDTARDPMLWFLVLTSGMFAVLGETLEALTLLFALVPLVGMDLYLHRRTLVSTAGLASRLAGSARTLREGRWIELPHRELVPGDLVEVGPGTYFPADGVLVWGAGLLSDESTLTGESLPVRKSAAAPGTPLSRAIADEHWGTAGTRLLTGTARMRVIWTGVDTRYGEIARAAAEGVHVITPLQRAISSLVGILLMGSLAVCVVLAAVRLWQGHGWIDALMSALTLAVAALPEEFPVVYTFFLGLGVFRLARRKALVRRAVAVENIGRTSCIVSDKTGTLTEGVVTLAHRIPAPGWTDATLLEVAQLAARPDSGDPLDESLYALGAPPCRLRRAQDFPFTEGRRRETSIQEADDGRAAAYTKGAPETILALTRITGQELAGWCAQVDQLAASGHKVIACARRDLPQPVSAQEPHSGFTFAGLLAFEDPLRPGVRDAVAVCLAAGIRVLMVTGDHPATAAAIAREVGLGGGSPKVSILGAGDDPSCAVDADVVARATPSQKLGLVSALQERGELVAVTGDGVNDVPALRKADIGVAMGERGTRAAREAASIVLLDDNFRTLVEAVAEGRQLFLNLRLAFAYLLLVHIPFVFGAVIIPLLGTPLLYLPVHIVWLELVIHPTAMLAFQELPARGPLGRFERQRQARFFSGGTWAAIALIGGFACAAVIFGYLHALGADHDVGHARAMAMAILLLCSAAFTIGLAGMRSAPGRWCAVGTVASLVVFAQLPVLSAWLHLRPLHSADWAMALLVAACAGLGSRGLARLLVAPPALR